jgi:hypothetical protein
MDAYATVAALRLHKGKGVGVGDGPLCNPGMRALRPLAAACVFGMCAMRQAQSCHLQLGRSVRLCCARVLPPVQVCCLVR